LYAAIKKVRQLTHFHKNSLYLLLNNWLCYDLNLHTMKTNIPSNPTNGTAAQYAQNLQLLADRQYIDRRVNIGQAYKTKPTPSNSTAANLLYPNPASGVAYATAMPLGSELRLYDLHGVLQFQASISEASAISLPPLASGIYIAHICTPDGNISTQKIVITSQ
jgi:hypothetical protein